MRNKVSNSVLGLFFIFFGIAFMGNAFDWWNFTVFFAGWWTMFIIIPCVYSMIRQGVNIGNLIGTAIGVILLLAARDVIEYDTARKIIAPSIIILVGIGIILKSFSADKNFKNIPTNNNENIPDASAIFGGAEPNYANMEFNGTNATAVFGGIDLNLRNAIIREDCVINCEAIFGGVDILLPPDVKVKVESIPIFGGVDNKYISSSNENAPTVYIKATCIFGGLDIK